MKIQNLVAQPRLFLLVLKTSEENITKSSRPRSSKPFQAQTGHLRFPSLCKRVTPGPWIYVNGSLPVPEICTNRWPLIPKYVFLQQQTSFFCRCTCYLELRPFVLRLCTVSFLLVHCCVGYYVPNGALVFVWLCHRVAELDLLIIFSIPLGASDSQNERCGYSLANLCNPRLTSVYHLAHKVMSSAFWSQTYWSTAWRALITWITRREVRLCVRKLVCPPLDEHLSPGSQGERCSDVLDMHFVM